MPLSWLSEAVGDRDDPQGIAQGSHGAEAGKATMRRVRLITDGSIVGHVEVYCLPLTGPGDYLCIPDGLLSGPDVQALAEALDRGEVVGRLGKCDSQASLETAAPVPPR